MTRADEDLLAIQPGALLAGGLRTGSRRPGALPGGSELTGVGARALAAQLAAVKVPREALEACLMIVDRAREDAPGIGNVPPAVLGRLASGLAVQASCHAVLAHWMDALRQAVRTRLDLDAVAELIAGALRLLPSGEGE